MPSSKEEKFMQLAQRAATDERAMEVFREFPMKFSIFGIFRGRGLKSVLRLVVLPVFLFGFSYSILSGQLKHTFGLPPMLVGIALLVVGLLFSFYVFRQFFVPDLSRVDEFWEKIHSQEIEERSSNKSPEQECSG